MRFSFVAAAVLALCTAAAPAFAQGGGASSTGTIQGRITDAQGAVLPGVTVTATSPSMLGPQTTVSSETSISSYQSLLGSIPGANASTASTAFKELSPTRTVKSRPRRRITR